MITRRQFATGALAVSAGAAGLLATQTDTAEAAPSAVLASMAYARQTGSSTYAGATNSQVKSLQLALQKLGYFIEATGTWSTWTTYVVKCYQYDRGLSQTGTLTTLTRNALIRGMGTWRKAGTRPPAMPVTKQSLAVSFGYSKIGAPYRYGATGPSSFDCSGFTQAAWRYAGVSIGRTTSAQYGSLAKVSKSALRQGDIVAFYRGSHVGLYVGGGYVIHSPRTGYTVCKVPMSQMPYLTAVRPSPWH